MAERPISQYLTLLLNKQSYFMKKNSLKYENLEMKVGISRKKLASKLYLSMQSAETLHL